MLISYTELFWWFPVLVVATAVFVYFLFALPVLRAIGAPFIPTDTRKMKAMIGHAGGGKGRKAADLGSGDGRLVIALARAGFEAHGYEVSPALVLWTRLRIFASGLQGRAFVHRISYWKEDLSGYDLVAVYGYKKIMPELQEKLRKELKSGSMVISNTFRLPDMEAISCDDGIFVYKF